MTRAAEWADTQENRSELARLLSDENYVGAPYEILHASLVGKPVLKPGSPPVDFPERHVFFHQNATIPSCEQAAWLTSQMQRWDQAPPDLDMSDTIRQVYRPDVYQDASTKRHQIKSIT